MNRVNNSCPELCRFNLFAIFDTLCTFFSRLVKPLFDSVVALPLDDPPLALAAAAVLYFLALDVRLYACAWFSKV